MMFPYPPEELNLAGMDSPERHGIGKRERGPRLGRGMLARSRVMPRRSWGGVATLRTVVQLDDVVPLMSVFSQTGLFPLVKWLKSSNSGSRPVFEF